VFGSIGGFELLLLAGIALLVFGPKRLPQMGRSLAQGLLQLKRITTELKTSLEKEAGLDDVKQVAGDLRNTISRESSKFLRDLESEAEAARNAAEGEERQSGAPGNPSP